MLKETPERDLYLDDACAGDAELRADLRRLLGVHGEAGSFLDRPVEAWLTGRDDVPFTGTDRFRILRQVGTGGMGIVYDTHDILRDEAVALKTLHRTRATNLYRLKREFRSLVDITFKILEPRLPSMSCSLVRRNPSSRWRARQWGVSFVDFARASWPGFGTHA